MIQMHLRAADLAETSFAVSALQETVFSLWVWRAPDRQAMHLPWHAAMESAWRRLDVEVLDALMAPNRWVPDFLTPRPATPFADAEAELEIVRATTPSRVRAELAMTYGDDPLPDVLRDRPARVLARITDALAAYWQACLLPYWPRIRSVLEADVVYRSRQLAVGGASALFADLDGRLRWDDGLLLIDRLGPDVHRVEVGGRGLRLTPSLFARGAVTYIDQSQPPMITYPARGRATVWELPSRPAEGAMVALLGAPRAQLLTLLESPATTTELAHRVGVSAPAVSQHLRVLRDARLVSRARSGRSVLYLRTELADGMLGDSSD